MATEKNPRREFVNKIVESMKGRDNAWQNTWKNMSGAEAPYNPITGTQYKGINFLALHLEQTKLKTNDPRWCTFDQAIESGYKIPKDTKAAHANFYDLKVSLNKGEESHVIKAKNNNEYISNIIAYYREQHPDKGKEIKTALSKANELKPTISSDKGKISLFVGELNKATGAKIELACFPYMKSFPIFNYSQLENVPELEIKPNDIVESYRRAEGILIASNAKIIHNSPDENFYNPEKHEIHLKSMDCFKTGGEYCSTALQEVTHWAMAEDLPFKPDLAHGDEANHLAHTREELRAELANIFISSELGLKLDVQDRPSHAGPYIELLENDYTELFSAVTDANKIANHILNFEKRLDLESTEAKELKSNNPELYEKIDKFNSLGLANDSIKNDALVSNSNNSQDKSAEKHNEIDKSISQDNSNKAYLEKFFEEKALPLTAFSINHGSETHIVESDAVINYLIHAADSKTQGFVKNILTELDFKNGDINNFLEYCASSMVKEYEADHDIEALSNTDAHEFKKQELEHELKSERVVSSVSPKETKEKAPAKVDNSIDDNDFSI